MPSSQLLRGGFSPRSGGPAAPPHQHQCVPCTFFDFSASFCSFQIFYSEHPMLPESEMNSECCFYNLPRSFPRPNSPARPNHSPGHAWLAPVCPHATSSPSLGSLSREDRVCLYPRGQASRGQGWRVPPRVLLVVTGVVGGAGGVRFRQHDGPEVTYTAGAGQHPPPCAEPGPRTMAPHPVDSHPIHLPAPRAAGPHPGTPGTPQVWAPTLDPFAEPLLSA